LKIARPAEPKLFSDDAIRLIAQASQGIPREINCIAFSALCIAYATRQWHIDADIVREAVDDRSLSLVSGQTDAKPYSAAVALAEGDATATPTRDRRTTGRRGADFQYVRSASQQVGLIVNIGPGGAALWVSAPDEWGDSQIQFRLPGVAFPLMIHGKVVWRHESQKLIGMLFSDVPPKARAALDAWLASPQDSNAGVELAPGTAPESTGGENYEEERVAIDFTRNDAGSYSEIPATVENGALSESSDQLHVGLSILRPPNRTHERVF
jgi:hypothetical protein